MQQRIKIKLLFASGISHNTAKLLQHNKLLQRASHQREGAEKVNLKVFLSHKRFITNPNSFHNLKKVGWRAQIYLSGFISHLS